MSQVDVTYRLATDDQYSIFWKLLQRAAADYLARTLELMQMSSEEFLHLFRTVGQVYGIYCGDALAGFYWIEERAPIVHLHGLILEHAFQGQGIGTQVLAMLADRYTGVMDAIELGVHASNVKARRLYAKLGYHTFKVLPDLDFYIMRYPLLPVESSGVCVTFSHITCEQAVETPCCYSKPAQSRFRYKPECVSNALWMSASSFNR